MTEEEKRGKQEGSRKSKKETDKEDIEWKAMKRERKQKLRLARDAMRL
jgi:hypothetical protein